MTYGVRTGGWRRRPPSCGRRRDDARVGRIYVTGHRNPDTDSIASAVGYAELRGRLDPGNEYVPVRLGKLNAQTSWVLERSGAPEPELLPHVLLRVRDVMRTRFPLADERDPVRQVGLIMARDEVDLVPVVDEGGRLAGRDDGARAGPALRARVARRVAARRSDGGRRDRRRARGRAARGGGGRAGFGPRVGARDGERLAPARLRGGRRGRRRRPARGPAHRHRGRRRAARGHERLRRGGAHPRARPRARHRPSSPRRSTATSPRG